MVQRLCCPECFDDRSLRDQLFPSLDPSYGACDFCGTADTQLVEPGKLANYFELLVNVYEPSEDGKSLVEWMKDDWQLFSHQRMDTAHAKELLGEILDDGEIVRKSFAPSPSYISEGLAQWDKLRDEMMYANRWFLDVAIDLDRLEQLFGMLLASQLPRNGIARASLPRTRSSQLRRWVHPRSDAHHMVGLILRAFPIFIWDQFLKPLWLR